MPDLQSSEPIGVAFDYAISQLHALVSLRPEDVVALNFFFDTLLFCGTILLLANAMDKETSVARA